MREGDNRVNVVSNIDGNIVNICVEGQVDAEHSESLKNQITMIMNEAPDKAVLLDLSRLEHISSSGLRVLLEFGKNKNNFEIGALSKEAKRIFAMSGVSTFLKLREPIIESTKTDNVLREVSIKGAKLIGEGGMGSVYRLNKDTMIKVYKPHVLLTDIERELKCSKIAFTQGFPTALSFDVVKVGEQYGAEYEMLEADLMSDYINEHPDLFNQYVDKYIEFAIKMNHTDIEYAGLPKTKDMLFVKCERIKKLISEEEYVFLKKLIQCIPDRNMMIHGDYHIRNVMIRNGKLMLIDFGDLSMGHPFFEVATIYSIYYRQSMQFPDTVLSVVGVTIEKALKIWNRFMNQYFSNPSVAKKEQLMKTFDIYATLRIILLCGGISGFEELFKMSVQQLMEQKEALELLKKADSLFD